MYKRQVGGGTIGQDISVSLGYPVIFVKTSKDTIKKVIIQAYSIINAKNYEENQLQLFNKVQNALHEGLMIVKNNKIQLMNNKMEQLLSVSLAQCINKDISNLSDNPVIKDIYALEMCIRDSFCRTLGYYIYTSSMTYYFNYYLKSAKLMGVILGISAPISAVAALSVAPVAKRIGKKKALVGCGLIFAVSSIIRYLMPLNTVVVAATCWAGMFVMSATLAIFFTMVADTTDYGMWLTGKNVRAVNYGFYTFCQKMGMAFSGTIVGLLLDMAGYIPNQEQSTAALSLSLIHICFQ